MNKVSADLRYLSGFDTMEMPCRRFGAVVVGAGLAGIYTALMLPRRMKVAVLCKGGLQDSDSYLAQGGIAASIGNDDRALHVEDTMRAGCGTNDRKAVDMLVHGSEDAIKSLVSLGVGFDRGENGAFLRSLEGGHSVKRILHSGGDATGKGIMDALTKKALERDNIEIIEQVFAADIATDDGVCLGVFAVKNGKMFYLASDFVIMATGGIGKLYPSSTNSPVLSGDGIAMARRAGVGCSGMEFVQFHPTAFYTGRPGGRAFLISEAVRGEGGLLFDADGKRFMPEYDVRAELAPRDVVARGIYKSMKKTGRNCVYLDITMKKRSFLEERFPTIFDHCKKHGLDMSKDRIPVAPVEHYFMGGIKTDLRGRTECRNLYAVGECACTGVHGANRLASNSLLEAVIFGAAAARDIEGCRPEAAPCCTLRYMPSKRKSDGVPPDVDVIEKGLRDVMRAGAGIIRTKSGLEATLSYINKEKDKVYRSPFPAPAAMEAADMLETAGMIAGAALYDTVSVGSHYRADEK